MQVRTAWERFQQGTPPGEPLDGVRHEILTSWRRSRFSKVDPSQVGLPQADLDADSRFARVAVPVVDGMASLLGGSDYSLAVTDPGGWVLWRWASAPGLRRDLDRLELVEGSSFGEEHAGTNGVGTSLETGHVVTVRGEEHFKEPFHRFTCVAAPVRHPVTHRTVGAVNLTCRAEHTNGFLEPAVVKLVHEVQDALLEAAGRRERRMFDAFLAVRARTTRPVLSVTPDVLVADETAAGLGLDHQRVWSRVLDAVEGGGRVHLPDADGRTAEVRPVLEGRRLVGAVLVVDPPAARLVAEGAGGWRAPVRSGVPDGPDRGVLSGVSASGSGGVETGAAAGAPGSWDGAVAAVRRVLDAGGVPVVRGEPGSGRAHLAREVLGASAVVLDAAGLDAAGLDAAGLDAAGLDAAGLDAAGLDAAGLDAAGPSAVPAGAPLVLRGAEALPVDLDLRGLIGGRRVVATWAGEGFRLPPALDALGATVVELAPLRERRGEVPALAAALLPDRSITGAALGLLAEHPWPGGVAELRALLRSVDAAAPPGTVGVEHLPRSLRATRRLTPLERAEAEVVAAALAAAGGNKSRAARELGLSRPTLYAKLRAYRIC